MCVRWKRWQPWRKMQRRVISERADQTSQRLSGRLVTGGNARQQWGGSGRRLQYTRGENWRRASDRLKLLRWNSVPQSNGNVERLEARRTFGRRRVGRDFNFPLRFEPAPVWEGQPRRISYKHTDTPFWSMLHSVLFVYFQIAASKVFWCPESIEFPGIRKRFQRGYYEASSLREKGS